MISHNERKLGFWKAGLLVILSAFSLHASVLTVTTLADSDDLVCDSNCSFREALKAAVAGDTIIFARDLRGGTITLGKTLLINKRLIIDGPNKRRITLRGNGTFRIIEGHAVISIDGLIIRNGGEATDNGGGIYSTGLLNLTNVAILDNSAVLGGGIYQYGGTLWLIDSVVANNTANGENAGGGIDTFLTDIRMINSTISGNRATSPVDGVGGIRIVISRSTWFMNHVTIAYNFSNGTSFRSGGGLVALNGTGGVSNSIVAKNAGLNPDIYGQVGALWSLVGITDARSGLETGVNGNIVGSATAPVDPQLGVLNQNGGGLLTHALLTGSPAIDSANNIYATDRLGRPLTMDERGFDRKVNSTVDMGAYEFNSVPATRTSTITGKVLNSEGQGIFGARIILRDQKGELRIAMTNPFGFYRFTNLATDQNYSLECTYKRGVYPQQQLLVEEIVEYVNFNQDK